MLIGIDTGGTYTDAVLFDERVLTGIDTEGDLDRPDALGLGGDDNRGILAWTKTRTRADLTIGIREALVELDPDPHEVSLVSLSTTLATNALVEGVGGRVGLVLIGFDDRAVERAGLAAALARDPLIMIDGGHDSYGVEIAPPDLAALEQAVLGLDVDSFAVASHFSVRNPAHELRARDLLATTGKPVACSHELSARLNGPKRALTCLLNARLLPLINDLCRAASTIMEELTIDAPLMLVRGDGSLVSADFALARPIETILSGPAASLVGAGYLCNPATFSAASGEAATIMVSDIGGTTTDIGLLDGDRPLVNPDGAVVGGHHTMVEAVDVYTVGLGGDSELHVDRNIPPSLRLGPRRVTPVSLAAVDDPDTVHRSLARRRAPFREDDVTFVRPSGRTGVVSTRDERLLQKMADRAGAATAPSRPWYPIDEIVTSSTERAALASLVRRGLVQVAGFTPSDASHVLEDQSTWDRTAALAAATIMAAISDNRGEPLRPDPESFSQWVVDQLVHQSAEAVLAVAFSADGIGADAVRHPLVQRALADPPTVSRVQVGAQVDLVGLGASAPTYYPAVAKKVSANGVIPPFAQVANAVGSVVGRVRVAARCTISQPSRGQYRIHWPGLEDRGDQQPAIDDALAALRVHVRAQAADAGADEVVLTERVDLKTANVEGKELLVEGTVEVVAVGRPRFARR
ncbi:MAG: hydantoinase/oxoprolinase family protein [Acidimicrobiia bacterium]|nr:hydantoinase/oxoprolinase family protein [Acidimicrobiia bacterium]